jgi:site-specific DNA-methyltransferase (adenine-specific)
VYPGVGLTPYYADESVTLYHGDCREILPALPDAGCVLVTDPPYGISHSSNRPGAPRRGEQIANDDATTVRDEVLALWGSRPALVFGSCRVQPPQIPVRATLVWDKGGHVGMGDLSLPWKQNWEHIYVSGQGFVGRRDTGVLRFNALAPWAGEYTHPHEKPVELMRALIEKCAPLATILDPFAGSGTTLRAAKDLGRSAIGIEIEERYCEVAVRRLGQEVLAVA